MEHFQDPRSPPCTLLQLLPLPRSKQPGWLLTPHWSFSYFKLYINGIIEFAFFFYVYVTDPLRVSNLKPSVQCRSCQQNYLAFDKADQKLSFNQRRENGELVLSRFFLPDFETSRKSLRAGGQRRGRGEGFPERAEGAWNRRGACAVSKPARRCPVSQPHSSVKSPPLGVSFSMITKKVGPKVTWEGVSGTILDLSSANVVSQLCSLVVFYLAPADRLAWPGISFFSWRVQPAFVRGYVGEKSGKSIKA